MKGNMGSKCCIRLALMLPVFILVFASQCGKIEAKADNGQHSARVHRRKIYLNGQVERSRHQSGSRQRQQRSIRPNIIMVMTDDQDVLLGSLKAMPKLTEYMSNQGALFKNMFVSTPMCCPSRSSILTGLYVHNHNVYTNHGNCSSPQWIQQHEPHTFAPYLKNAGYRTGYFGKYLNKYNGSYTPVGWDEWIGLVRNSRFYNYTLSYGGRLQRHFDNYYEDYLTNRIANDSLAFFKRAKRFNPAQPVMMVLSLPAPHGPEDAAPQYQHMFVNNTDHRTPSWNVAPNLDKQWLLRQASPMTPQFKIFTDLLQRRRLQTLQSVDDLIEKVYTEIGQLGELDNTYIVYTSDHGYHLGQFGLIKGKSLAYDFDTRVPLIVTGPGIKPGSQISNVAANVDLAPTLLDMGRVQVPSHMDGTSLLPLLKATTSPQRADDKSFIRTTLPWRDTVLLERGKVSKKLQKLRMKEERKTLMQQKQKNLHLYLPPRQQKMLRQCQKRSYQTPCKPEQTWFCVTDAKGRMQLRKCQPDETGSSYNNTIPVQQDQPQMCKCRDGSLGIRLSSIISPSPTTSLPSKQQPRWSFKQQVRRKARGKLVRQRRSVMREAFGRKTHAGSMSGVELFTRRCRILPNDSVTCDHDIYHDYNQWRLHRDRLDDMIKEYRKVLEDLRNIRQHLQENQPSVQEENEDNPGSSNDIDAPLADNESCYCRNESSVVWQLDERAERKLQRHLQKEQNQIRRAQRQQRKSKKKKKCNSRHMKCFSHDNNHWKTPPYWVYGPFCFCSNANSNVYWCMRTINATSDFLYCEYITNFIAFYDLTTDPHQLKNVAKRLKYGILQQLHEQLAKLKMCQGPYDCNLNNHKDSRIPVNSLLWREQPSIFRKSEGDGVDSSDKARWEGYVEDDEDSRKQFYEEQYDSDDEDEEYAEPSDPDFF